MLGLMGMVSPELERRLGLKVENCAFEEGQERIEGSRTGICVKVYEATGLSRPTRCMR